MPTKRHFNRVLFFLFLSANALGQAFSLQSTSIVNGVSQDPSDDPTLTFTFSQSQTSLDDNVKVWGSLSGDLLNSISVAGQSVTLDIDNPRVGETVTISVSDSLKDINLGNIDKGYVIEYLQAGNPSIDSTYFYSGEYGSLNTFNVPDKIKGQALDHDGDGKDDYFFISEYSIHKMMGGSNGIPLSNTAPALIQYGTGHMTNFAMARINDLPGRWGAYLENQNLGRIEYKSFTSLGTFSGNTGSLIVPVNTSRDSIRMVVKDMNGNGLQDVVLFHTTPTVPGIQYSISYPEYGSNTTVNFNSNRLSNNTPARAPIQMRVADMNNDYTQDLLFMMRDGAIYAMNGTSIISTLTSGSGTYVDFEVVDWNSDGYKDLIFIKGTPPGAGGNANWTSNKLEISYGSSSGFGTRNTLLNLSRSVAQTTLKIQDLDTEGHHDLFLLDNESHTIRWVQYKTNLSGIREITIDSLSDGRIIRDLDFLDVNGDGILGMIALFAQSGSSDYGIVKRYTRGLNSMRLDSARSLPSSLTMHPDGNITLHFSHETSPNTANAAKIHLYGSRSGEIDFNVTGLGTDELVINPTRNLFLGERVELLVHDIENKFGAIMEPDAFRTHFRVEPATTTMPNVFLRDTLEGLVSWFRPEFVDVDRDGNLELTSVSNSSFKKVAASVIANGTSLPISSTFLGSFSQVGDCIFYDYSGDGTLDLILSEKSGSSLFMVAYTEQGTTVNTGLPNVSNGQFEVSYFNNSGSADLLLSAISSPPTDWTIYRHTGGLNWTAQHTYNSLVLGDFLMLDFIGVNELFYAGWDYSTGEVLVEDFLTQNEYKEGLGNSSTPNPSTKKLLPFDYNGDLNTDILAVHAGEGVSVINYDEQDQLVTGEHLQNNTSVDDFTVCDYDGDGDFDVIQVANNKLVWLENTGGYSVSEHVLDDLSDWTAGSLELQVADADGNGEYEIYAFSGNGSQVWRWTYLACPPPTLSGTTILPFNGVDIELTEQTFASSNFASGTCGVDSIAFSPSTISCSDVGTQVDLEVSVTNNYGLVDVIDYPIQVTKGASAASIQSVDVPSTYCAGQPITLTITGSLNGANSWKLYSGSCGGTYIDSTTTDSLTFTPSASGTYYVSSSSSCSALDTCVSFTINSNTTPPDFEFVDITKFYGTQSITADLDELFLFAENEIVKYSNYYYNYLIFYDYPSSLPDSGYIQNKFGDWMKYYQDANYNYAGYLTIFLDTPGLNVNLRSDDYFVDGYLNPKPLSFRYSAPLEYPCNYSVSFSKSQFDCTDLGANNVSVTITGADGLQTSGSFNLTIADTIEPSYTIPEEVYAYLDANGQLTIDSTNWGISGGDNCEVSTLQLTNTSFTCSDVGVTAGPPLQVIAQNDYTGSIAPSSGNSFQTFTAPSDGILESVELYLRRPHSNGAYISVEIRAGESSTGQLLGGSDTIFETSVSPVWRTLSFDSISMVQGQTYSIVYHFSDYNVAWFPVHSGPSAAYSKYTGGFYVGYEPFWDGNPTNRDAPFRVNYRTGQGKWVHFTAEDASGNQFSDSINVIIADSTAPVVQSNNVIYLNPSSTSVALDQGAITASDNCGVESLLISPPSYQSGDPLNSQGAFEVTVTATDSSGNQTTEVLSLYPVDCSKDTVTVCSSGCDFPNLQSALNCSKDTIIIHLAVNGIWSETAIEIPDGKYVEIFGNDSSTTFWEPTSYTTASPEDSIVLRALGGMQALVIKDLTLQNWTGDVFIEALEIDSFYLGGVSVHHLNGLWSDSPSNSGSTTNQKSGGSLARLADTVRGGDYYLNLLSSGDRVAIRIDSSSFFTNGALDGGVIISHGYETSVELSHVEVHNNSALNGGFIFFNSRYASFTATYSNLDSNFAQNSGGVIQAAENLAFTFKNGGINNNRVNSAGGVVTCYRFFTSADGDTVFSNAQVVNNESANFGGVIIALQAAGKLGFYSTTLRSNEASAGANFYTADGSLSEFWVRDCIVDSNYSTQGPAFLYAATGLIKRVDIRSSTFNYNVGGVGTILYADSVESFIADSVYIDSNYTFTDGLILMNAVDSLSITNSSIQHNTSNAAGTIVVGLRNTGYGNNNGPAIHPFRLENVEISNNSTQILQGGVPANMVVIGDQYGIELENCRIDSNNTWLPGVYADGYNSVYVSNTTFIGNVSDSYRSQVDNQSMGYFGPLLLSGCNDIHISNSIFHKNHTGDNYFGLYPSQILSLNEDSIYIGSSTFTDYPGLAIYTTNNTLVENSIFFSSSELNFLSLTPSNFTSNYNVISSIPNNFAGLIGQNDLLIDSTSTLELSQPVWDAVRRRSTVNPLPTASFLAYTPIASMQQPDSVDILNNYRGNSLHTPGAVEPPVLDYALMPENDSCQLNFSLDSLLSSSVPVELSINGGAWSTSITYAIPSTDSVTILARMPYGNDYYVDTAYFTGMLQYVLDQDISLVAAKDTTLYLDASGQASFTAASVDNGTTDSCGIMAISVSDSVFACADEGVNQIWFYATDINGNRDSVQFAVTVSDSIKPVLTAHDTTFYIDPTSNFNFQPADFILTSSDNCGIESFRFDDAGSVLDSLQITFADTGMKNVFVEAVDSSGNAGRYAITLNIIPGAPEIICWDQTVTLGTDNGLTIMGHELVQTATFYGTPSYSATPSFFDCTNLGPNNVMVVLTDDASGLSDTCYSILTIGTYYEPTIIAPSDTILYLANGCSVNYTWNISVDADCPQQNTLTQLSGPQNGTDLAPGTYSISYAIPGADSVSWNVEVRDSIAPVFQIFPQDTTLYVDGSCAVNYQFPAPSASDNCTSAGNVNIVQSQGYPQGTSLTSGLYTYAFTASDEYNNQTSQSFSVTVLDTLGLQVFTQLDTVYLDSTGQGMGQYSDLLVGVIDQCNPSATFQVDSSGFMVNCNDLSQEAGVVDSSLTFNFGYEVGSVAISPDGQTIAFAYPGPNEYMNVAVTHHPFTSWSNIIPTPYKLIDYHDLHFISNNQVAITYIELLGNPFGVNTIVFDVNGASSTLIANEITDGPVSDLGPDGIYRTLVFLGEAHIRSWDGVSIGQNAFNYQPIVNGVTGAEMGLNDFLQYYPYMSYDISMNGQNQILLVHLQGFNSASETIVAFLEESITGDSLIYIEKQRINFLLNNIHQTRVPDTDSWTIVGNNDNSETVSYLVEPSGSVAAYPNIPNLLGARHVWTAQNQLFAVGHSLQNEISIYEFQGQGVTGSWVLRKAIPAAPWYYSLGFGAVATPSGNIYTPVLDPSGSQLSLHRVFDENVEFNFMVSSDSGAVGQATGLVAVFDTISPNAQADSVTLYVDAQGEAGIDASHQSLSSWDNCGVTTETVWPSQFSCSNLGSNTAYYAVKDASQNTDTAYFTITLLDTISPILVAQNAQVNAGDTLNPSTFVAQLSDNCSANPTVTINPVIFDCSSLGNQQVTLTATDASGNVTSAVATVQVGDQTDPVVTCNNRTIYLDPLTGTYTEPDVASLLYISTFDDCSSIVDTIYNGPLSFDCSDVGQQTVVVTVVDAYGNTGSCTSTLTVVDQTPPLLTLQTATVYLDAQGQGVLTSSDVVLNATDACGVASLLVEPHQFNCSDIGAQMVFVTGEDIHGNLTGDSIMIQVSDTLPPNVSCSTPGPIGIPASGVLVLDTTIIQVSMGDACGGPFTYSFNPTQITCAQIGQAVPVLVSVTDVNGNTANCTTTLQIQDVEGPQIQCLADTVFVGSGVDCIVNVNWDPPMAVDACSGVVSVTQISGILPNTSHPVGVYTVVYEAIDAAGNASTCSFDVIIEDQSAPHIVGCPSNQVFYTSQSGCAPVATWNPPTALDACGPAPVNQISGPTPGSALNPGTHLVVYVTQDAQGNSDTCSFSLMVIDDLDPFILCAPSMTIGASPLNCMSAASWQPIQVSDECGGVTFHRIDGLPYQDGDSLPIGIHSFVYEAIDAAGNTSVCTTTITVEDQSAPQFTQCPSDLFFQADSAQCSAVVNWLEPTAIDNCAGIASIQQTQGPSSGSSLASGSYLIEYEAVDGNGNMATCSFTLTVEDVTAPQFTDCPSTINLEADPNSCLAAATWNVPTAVDVCDSAPIVTQIQGPVPGSLLSPGSYMIVYSAMDASGNENFCAFNILVEDVTEPYWTDCSTDTTIYTVNAGCRAVAGWDIPQAVDACGAPVNVQQTAGPAIGSLLNTGVYTVTYTATDSSGNQSICTFNVEVSDGQAPQFVNCPQPMMLTADSANCQAIATWSAPMATDDCSSQVPVTQISGPTPGTALAPGLYSVSYRASDNSGNADTCSFTISVVDVIPPQFVSCPQNVMVPITLTSSCETSLPIAALTPVATDACGPVSVAQTGGHLLNSPAAPGAYTATFTATDAAGLSAQCTVSFTVVDQVSPVLIEAPADTLVYVDASTCMAALHWDLPVVIDNPGQPCENQAIVTQTSGPVMGDEVPPGVYTVSYAAADLAGNALPSIDFIITVVNGVPPAVVSCPSNIQTSASLGSCGKVVAYAQPQFAAGCGGNITVSQVSGLPSGNTFPVGTTTNIFVATDVTGLTDTCTFTVTITDNEAPTWSCPANMVVPADPQNCVAVVALPTPSASDNCTGVLSYTVLVDGATVSPTASLSLSTGSHNVTYIATDASGNSSFCSFSISVVDVTAPVFTCPANITLPAAIQSCGQLVQAQAPTAVDACGGSVNVVQTSGPALGSFMPVGIHVLTFNATDGAGNTATCSFTVTITDDEAPVLSAMNDLVVPVGLGSCVATPQWNPPTAYDACAQQVTVQQLSGPVSGTSLSTGIYTIVYAATDAAGNIATDSFNIQVIDDQAPLISCIPNITVSADPGQCAAAVTFTEPTATDNCTPASDVLIQVVGGANSGGVFPVGSTPLTYIFTDQSGNSAACSFVITVLDNEAPVVSNCPSDIVVTGSPVFCNAPVSYTTPTATDNCGPVTITQISGFASGSLFPAGTTTNVFQLTDAAGNSTTCSFNVTVENSFEVVLSDTAFCDQGVLSAPLNPQWQYQWSTGGTNSSVTVSQSGMYTVTVTTPAGCSDTAQAQVTVNASPAVTQSGYPFVICVYNPPFQLDGGLPLGGSSFVNGQPATVFDPAAAGPGFHYITYEYTDANGCWNQASHIIIVNNCLGDEELHALESAQVYPNPFEDSFTLELDVSTPVAVELSLSDAMGRIVMKEVRWADGGLNRWVLDGLSIAQGVYHLQVTSGDHLQVIKLVKHN